MKKYIVLVFVLPTILHAQELDTLATDSLEKVPPPYYAGIYLVPGGEWSPHTGGYNASASLGVGMQYERWFLNISINEFQGEVEAFVVFPNVFSLKYRYREALLGYTFLSHEWFSGNLIAGMAAGDMVWTNKETNEDFLRDEFTMLKGGILISLDKFRYAKPYVILGYQQAHGIELPRLENDDFSGIFLAVGLRIGYFNQ